MAKAKKLKSGNWRVLVYDYTDDNGKRHYVSFTHENKSEAEFMAAEFARDKKRRKTPSKLTLGEAMDKYIASKDGTLSPATIREYKRKRNSSFKSLVEVQLKDLTQELIQQEINNYSKTLSAKTVRDLHGFLSSVLDVYNPEFKLQTTLPQQTKPNIHVPTEAEIKKIISHSRGTDIGLAIRLAAFCSLRRSEISALDDKDVQGNLIHISKAMVQNEYKEWIIKSPKTYAGDRYICPPESIIKDVKNIEGRIVNLNPNQITKQFKNLLKSLGIPHFKFHALRHFFASDLHAMSVPDQYIMEMGGWKSAATLKNIYQHTMDEKAKEISGKVNNHFRTFEE